MGQIRFRAVAEDGRRMAAANADVMQKGAVFDNGPVQFQLAIGQDLKRFVLHLIAVQ